MLLHSRARQAGGAEKDGNCNVPWAKCHLRMTCANPDRGRKRRAARGCPATQPASLPMRGLTQNLPTGAFCPDGRRLTCASRRDSRWRSTCRPQHEYQAGLLSLNAPRLSVLSVHPGDRLVIAHDTFRGADLKHRRSRPSPLIPAGRRRGEPCLELAFMTSLTPQRQPIKTVSSRGSPSARLARAPRCRAGLSARSPPICDTVTSPVLRRTGRFFSVFGRLVSIADASADDWPAHPDAELHETLRDL